MSFFKASCTKNIHKQQATIFGMAAAVGYSPWNITIPVRLLSSRARFRLMMNMPNLKVKTYIYKLS